MENKMDVSWKVFKLNIKNVHERNQISICECGRDKHKLPFRTLRSPDWVYEKGRSLILVKCIHFFISFISYSLKARMDVF